MSEEAATAQTTLSCVQLASLAVCYGWRDSHCCDYHYCHYTKPLRLLLDTTYTCSAISFCWTRIANPFLGHSSCKWVSSCKIEPSDYSFLCRCRKTTRDRGRNRGLSSSLSSTGDRPSFLALLTTVRRHIYIDVLRSCASSAAKELTERHMKYSSSNGRRRTWK